MLPLAMEKVANYRQIKLLSTVSKTTEKKWHGKYNLKD